MPAFHNLDDETVYAILVVNNPMMWKSRIALYHQTHAHLVALGFQVLTVEHQTGTRPFEVTSSDNPMHVQLRGSHDQLIWLKEALINVGVRHLTRIAPGWKYLVTADADIRFLADDIVARIRHELQLTLVGQPWSHSIDLGPQHQVLENENGKTVDRSFAAAFMAGEARDPNVFGDYKGDPRQHPGFVWYYHRVAFEGMGGLMDWVVTGAADWYMAYSLAGIKLTGDDDLSAAYRRRLTEWFNRVQPVVKRRIGVIPGTIVHGYHGPKVKRAYVSRREILKRSNFNPDTDLAYDTQGIPFVCSDNFELLTGMRRYFETRDEDSASVA